MQISTHTTDVGLTELKDMLVSRRREIQTEIDARKRSGRSTHTSEVNDMVDMSDASIEEEMSFALLEMRTTMLARVDEALARVQNGTYGVCSDCGASIAPGRLRALPFAVRCRDCEARLEREAGESQRLRPYDRSGTALSPEVRSL